MTTILVTGATGTVGSELVKQLISSPPSSLPPSDIKVRGAIHSQNKVEEFRQNNRNIEVAVMDFNKPQTVADALNGVDKLFWLTLPRPNMTEAPTNLIRETKKNDVRQIVKLSVFQFIGSIGRWHRHEEKIIEESGIPYAFLRAGGFMQNFIPRYPSDCSSTRKAGQTKTCQVTVEGIMPPAKSIVTTINGPFNGPESLASDPINGNVYVANYGDYNKIGTVSVIDGTKNVVIANISVDNNPTAIAYDYYNNNMYVTNLFSNTVSDISASNNTAISSVPIYGIHPSGIGYDPANNNIYVSNLDSKSFSVIDTSTNWVIPNLPINGNPQAVTYDYANGDMYMATRMWGPTNEVNGTVNVIDPKNAVVDPITVGIYPYAIAYDSLNKDMYVANFGSNTVSVINSLTNTVIATIPVGTNPSGVAYDPDNGNLYVSNVIPNNASSDNVSVIDGSTNTVIGTVPVGNNPYGITYDSFNKDIYTANLGSNTVSVIHP